jgi:hypothetical protein
MIWLDTPGETLVIQQFQQSGEALAIAVVRRGREEEFMLEVWREAAQSERFK